MKRLVLCVACIVLPTGLVAVPGADAAATTDRVVRHLNLADDGRTIHVTVGTRIVVRLRGDSGHGYAAPESTNNSVVRFHLGTSWPEEVDAYGRFKARSVGRARLTSSDDYTCLHANPPCEVPQREWWVRVVVRAAD